MLVATVTVLPMCFSVVSLWHLWMRPPPAHMAPVWAVQGTCICAHNTASHCLSASPASQGSCPNGENDVLEPARGKGMFVPLPQSRCQLHLWFTGISSTIFPPSPCKKPYWGSWGLPQGSLQLLLTLACLFQYSVGLGCKTLLMLRVV